MGRAGGQCVKEFMAGNDMETQGHNSFQSGNASVEQKQQQKGLDNLPTKHLIE